VKAIKGYGEGGRAPLILNLGTMLLSAASFAHQPLCHRQKRRRYLQNRGLFWLRSRSGHCGEETNPLCMMDEQWIMNWKETGRGYVLIWGTVLDFASGDYGWFDKPLSEIWTHVIQEIKPPDRPFVYVMWHLKTVGKNVKCMFIAPQTSGEQNACLLRHRLVANRMHVYCATD